jgi:hypothetical protein
MGRAVRREVADEFHVLSCSRKTAASPGLSSRFSAMAIMAS